MTTQLQCAIVLLGVSSLLTGQRVLRVAPTGAPYAQIQDAVNAAAPGDTILVATGTYTGFRLSIGLSILAEAQAAVVVNGMTSVFNVPPDQQVTLCGITFRAGSSGVTPDPFALQLNGMGSVRVVACRCESILWPWQGQGRPRPEAALFVYGLGPASNAVVLDDLACVGRSGAAALKAGMGAVTLVIRGGQYVGGDSDCLLCPPGSMPAGIAIHLNYTGTGSVPVYLSDVDAQGGSAIGGSSEIAAGHGFMVYGLSLIHI